MEQRSIHGNVIEKGYCFGDLHVVGKSDGSLGYKRLWLVRCVLCSRVFRAAEIEILERSLRCECLEETYSCWQNMLRSNSNLGQTVCREWRYSFVRFMADMGRQPWNSYLERVDTGQLFSSANCRWTLLPGMDSGLLSRASEEGSAA